MAYQWTTRVYDDGSLDQPRLCTVKHLHGLAYKLEPNQIQCVLWQDIVSAGQAQMFLVRKRKAPKWSHDKAHTASKYKATSRPGWSVLSARCFMGILGGIPPNAQRLSCILIDCIFYGVVKRICGLRCACFFFQMIFTSCVSHSWSVSMCVRQCRLVCFGP